MQWITNSFQLQSVNFVFKRMKYPKKMYTSQLVVNVFRLHKGINSAKAYHFDASGEISCNIEWKKNRNQQNKSRENDNDVQVHGQWSWSFHLMTMILMRAHAALSIWKRYPLFMNAKSHNERCAHNAVGDKFDMWVWFVEIFMHAPLLFLFKKKEKRVHTKATRENASISFSIELWADILLIVWLKYEIFR